MDGRGAVTRPMLTEQQPDLSPSHINPSPPLLLSFVVVFYTSGGQRQGRSPRLCNRRSERRRGLGKERGRAGGKLVLAGGPGGGGEGRGFLNQRSAPVTPSGVPPSGHVPKIATGAVSSKKKKKKKRGEQKKKKRQLQGPQPVCQCEIFL